jgi:hypothetical protein
VGTRDQGIKKIFICKDWYNKLVGFSFWRGKHGGTEPKHEMQDFREDTREMGDRAKSYVKYSKPSLIRIRGLSSGLSDNPD